MDMEHLMKRSMIESKEVCNGERKFTIVVMVEMISTRDIGVI